ncbi:hypothetical protein PIIN_08642 [Serendipita indica DSM 11827]|uniref:Uncharacterized protein n=1 Tax=Serendipita indica (strain DSM 11827) TaxID=1109443 RepID=G4TTP8_SERID|nr:hypothetical protein PIIN_08642 [Serendipita indica DSM 11827]
MRTHPLSAFLSFALLAIGAAARDALFGTDDARILYDKSWVDSAENSKLKTSVNGSIYLLYGDLTIHYAPPKNGSMHLWVDGRECFDLKLAATTAPQSSIDSSLKEATFKLYLADHQIHISGSSSSTSDPMVFGGLNINLDGPDSIFTNWGVPRHQNVEIIDNTAFNYSSGWEVAAEAPFSYESTLMRTRTKGAWVSYTFQKPYLQFWTYGTRGEHSVVQAIYPYHSGQVQSGVSSLYFPVNETLVQTLISSNRDWGTPGTFVNFTLEEGTMAVDFIAVIYGEPPKPNNTVKIAVPVVILGVAVLVAVAYFVVRSRKRKATEEEKRKNEPYFFEGLEKPKGAKP